MTHQYIITGVYIGGILLTLFFGEVIADRMPRRHRNLIALYAFVWPLAGFVAVPWLGKKVRRWMRGRAR